MQRVYIWKDYGLQTGHVSLYVDPGSSNHRRYLSFHPKSRMPPRGVDPFDHDQRTYSLVESVDLFSVDDWAAVSYIDAGFDDYQVFLNNCASTVAKALLIGFAKHVHDMNLADRLSWEARHSAVARLFPYLRHDDHSPAAEIVFDKLPILVSIAARTPSVWGKVVAAGLPLLRIGTWTPDDVCQLAHEIKSMTSHR